jgi:hypothetical protein
LNNLAGKEPPLFVLCSFVIVFGYRRNNNKKKQKKNQGKSAEITGRKRRNPEIRVVLLIRVSRRFEDTEIGTKRCPLLWAVVTDW